MIDQPPAGPKKPDPQEPAGGDGRETPSKADEQMAAYEEALKEEDWGHQPC